jgi:death-on-curing protein
VTSFCFFTIQDVINIHTEAIDLFGGARGVRDLRLLDSAVAQPSMVIAGQYIYPSVFLMAAAYAFHIIKNHAFIDGNKRTGMATALLFLDLNNHSINLDNHMIYNMALAVAQSKMSIDDIALFFETAFLTN